MQSFSNYVSSNLPPIASLSPLAWRKWRDRPLHDPYAMAIDPPPAPPGPVSKLLERLASYAYDYGGDAIMIDLPASVQQVNDLAQDIQCSLSLDGEDKSMQIDVDPELASQNQDVDMSEWVNASSGLTLLSESTPSQGGVIVVIRPSDMTPVARAVVTEVAPSLGNPFTSTSSKLVNVLHKVPAQQDTFTASWPHAELPHVGSEVVLRNGDGEKVGMARVTFVEAPLLSSSTRQGPYSGNGNRNEGEGFLKQIWNPKNIFLSFVYPPSESCNKPGSPQVQASPMLVETPEAQASPMLVDSPQTSLPPPCTPVPSTPPRTRDLDTAWSLVRSLPSSPLPSSLPPTPVHLASPRFEPPVQPVQSTNEPCEDPFKYELTPPATPACSDGTLEDSPALVELTTPLDSPAAYYGLGYACDDEDVHAREGPEEMEPTVVEEEEDDDMEEFDYERVKFKDKGKGKMKDHGDAEAQQDMEEDKEEEARMPDTSDDDSDEADSTDDQSQPPEDTDSDDDSDDNDEAGQGSIVQQTSCQPLANPGKDIPGPSRGPRNPFSNITNTVGPTSAARPTRTSGPTIRIPATRPKHARSREAAKASAESKERVRKMKARAAKKAKDAKGKAREVAREEAKDQPSAKALGKRKAEDVDSEDEDDEEEDGERKDVESSRKRARIEEDMVVDKSEVEEEGDLQAQLDDETVTTQLGEVDNADEEEEEEEFDYAAVRQELDSAEGASGVPATSESYFAAPSFSSTSHPGTSSEFVQGSSSRPLQRVLPTRPLPPVPSVGPSAPRPAQIPEFVQGSSSRPLEEVAPSTSGSSQGKNKGKRRSTDDDEEEENQRYKRHRHQDVVPPSAQEDAMWVDQDNSQSSPSSSTPPIEEYPTESTPPPALRQSKGTRKAEDTIGEQQDDIQDTPMDVDPSSRPVKKHKGMTGVSITSSSYPVPSPYNIFGYNKEMLNTTRVLPQRSSMRVSRFRLTHQGKTVLTAVKEAGGKQDKKEDKEDGKGAQK